jgi:hypothetical protein
MNYQHFAQCKGDALVIISIALLYGCQSASGSDSAQK